MPNLIKLADKELRKKGFVTVQEAVNYLPCKTQWVVYNMIQQGRLDSVKVGHRRMISVKALEDYWNRMIIKKK